ncbi:ABC transporter permease/substrate-binding protein [Chitinophaga sp. GCM10012297]|uniref:ABC transporter permease/substrate-binding protein n=1 Tax=Chitinophaga chungangae TaxID=2821488 RepID=A0ABS3YAP6_9BACT|nr:ABC transporter permease/substrate-binding protein [Chitinophaga chungangae]MBO9151224.1 ABC transporter permease/substrate-binding protein [Chitinophaga chungangae]
MNGFFEFLVSQSDKLLQQTLTHISLTLISVGIAIAVGVPLGILIAKRAKIAGTVLGFAGVMQTIPSIALLGFLIPLLGIGPKPAIFALFLYALLPIIRNTYTGINGVDAYVKEAAKGMGMTPRQVLFKVELPLAMPVLIAGIRTAAVINVGVATLAAYIAAGGLGEFIFGGIALNNTNMILAGAIPAALLALLFDFLLSRIQKTDWRKYKLLLGGAGIAILCFAMLPAATKGKLLAGFTPEFMGRQDGYLGLKSVYHLRIPTVVINDAVMYQALHENKLDVVSGYSTDGRIRAYNLVILGDDKFIFPPYYAAPVVRQPVLEQYPELENALDLLAGRINDSVMTYLNYRVDYLKESPEQVAESFLQEQRLLLPPRAGNKGVVRIGTKIFTEQYILGEMYKMLIQGHTDLRVESKTGLGGTKICFDALTNNQIDLYPEYTGTGLLVILQAPLTERLRNKDSVYAFVQEQFSERYRLSWLKPIGFNNAYALMMRREKADELQLRTITDLTQLLNTQKD